MPSVRLSPGRLTALWLVLRTLDSIGGRASARELHSYASMNSLRSGALPISDGVALAVEGGFAVSDATQLDLAPLGRRALSMAQEDEPTDDLRRLFLSVLLLRDPPPWVAFWQGNPDDLDLVVPETERRLLNEVGLLPPREGGDPTNWAWWNALAHTPPSEDASAHRKLIGDAGEALTVEYELKRLRAAGYDKLANQVRWVAQESPAWGFDVLSFSGLPTAPDEPLAIEVKSLSRPSPTSFELFLSVHEWETATRATSGYVLHLWDGVNPGPPARARTTEPRILEAMALVPHLPQPAECRAQCTWASAHIVLRT
jgi:hypothetical protein